MPKKKVKDQIQPYTPTVKSTLTLSEDDLPEIKNWNIGKKYKVELEIEQTGADAHPDAEGDVPSEARFKVVSAKVIGGKGSKDKGDQMMGQQTPTRDKMLKTMSDKAQTY